MGILRPRLFLAALLIAGGVPAVCGAASSDGGAATAGPRIVSLSPHITELLFAAGAGRFVVGVDDASDYPPAAARVPRIGEVGALDVERLLTLRPTRVIVWGGGTTARQRAQLERLNLNVLVTEQRRLEDVGTALREFGRLAGSSAVADAAAQAYDARLADLRARYAGRSPLRVFYQVWDRPLYTLSGNHPVSEIITLCGGRNVFSDLGPLAPEVDRETVITRDPDVILIGADGAEGARQSADWRAYRSVRAVARGAVYTVDPALLGRMTPRVLDGVLEVCDRLERARDAIGNGTH